MSGILYYLSMAQAIPYNALHIPELAPTLDDIAPQFEKMQRLELPGILIPDAGSDDVTAIHTLRPILGALGLGIHRDIPPIQHREGHGDQPLHIDAIPSDHESVGMVVQCTRIGHADIVLAKLADPFCSTLTKRNAGVHDHSLGDYTLPEDTEALLKEGLVDPATLQPDIYIGSVAVGGAIMFTFGGPNPIAHRFRTTTSERYAKGYIVPFTRL
jgi:hypothetical protein